MRTETTSNGEVRVILSRDEFGILQNALNEALESVAPSEATSRLGATVAEVENLLRTFRDMKK